MRCKEKNKINTDLYKRQRQRDIKIYAERNWKKKKSKNDKIKKTEINFPKS